MHRDMAVLIDEPIWPAHDRLWGHLVSDASLDELHAFAAARGSRRAASITTTTTCPSEQYRDTCSPSAPSRSPAASSSRRLQAAGCG